ncbi:FecR domain-containing protein [Pseudanabaena sp. 'Roaring Creek']|uniref:FecR family protein n=1 Tax=Pseudanabaena sp. 'Roaring Creek' TaxID=1681830 RepID=UPI0006D81A6B|nr:FecR family protein [Pseudanabaena sp. 'Roaring Creek']
MLQKRPPHPKFNLIFIAFLGLCIDVSGAILLPQSKQGVIAQNGIQVRTNQWLKVEKVSGNVTYRNLYNYENRSAQNGDLLQTPSDEISTGANGTAVLSVDTGVGSIYVSENTTIRINSFKIAADNGRITNLFVPRGKARLQIRKFTNRGSQLNIQTPAGISGVRGTRYIVQAKNSGDMVITTLQGSVATTAQNQTKMVNGGFQNLTVVGQPPSTPVPINNDASLRYAIDRRASGSGRSIVLIGYTNPFNTVKVEGKEQALDRSGKFYLQLPAPSSLKIAVTVETTTGKIQVYEIPIL